MAIPAELCQHLRSIACIIHRLRRLRTHEEAITVELEASAFLHWEHLKDAVALSRRAAAAFSLQCGGCVYAFTSSMVDIC